MTVLTISIIAQLQNSLHSKLNCIMAGRFTTGHYTTLHHRARRYRSPLHTTHHDDIGLHSTQHYSNTTISASTAYTITHTSSACQDHNTGQRLPGDPCTLDLFRYISLTPFMQSKQRIERQH